MGSGVLTAFCLTVGVYLLLQHQHSLVQGAPNPDVTSGSGHRNQGRPALLPRLTGPRAVKYVKSRLLPLEGDELLLDDDDVIEFNKRQSEDYGHMRFGKREEFDDYGHLRFGRSVDH